MTSLWKSFFCWRCPACEKGKLFKKFLSLTELCPYCGLPLSHYDIADGPSYFTMFILCTVTVPLVLMLEYYFEPPYWVHMVVWPLFLLGFSYGLLKGLRSVFVTLHYQHQHEHSQ